MKGFEKNPELGRALHALGSAVALKTARKKAAAEQHPFYKDNFYKRSPESVEEAKSRVAAIIPDPPEIKPVPFWKEEQELTLRLIQGQTSDTKKFKQIPLPLFEQAAE